MASIFYKAGGNFSGLTPQKIVSANYNLYLGSSYTGYHALNIARYVAFTPSVSGTCEGVMLALRVANKSDQSVTVTLQEQTSPSVWTDRATKTVSYDDIIGTHKIDVEENTSVAWTWKYFQFESSYAITTSDNTWRVSIASTDNTAHIFTVSTGSGTYAHAVVLSDTTTYSSGDDIFVKDEVDVIVDQSITATTWLPGTNSGILWQNPPVAAYTLTITNLYMTAFFSFRCGSPSSRIPFAQKATISISNRRGVLIWAGDRPIELELYGEIPENIVAYVSSNAASGQAKINTTVDLSSSWSGSDQLWVFCNTTAQDRTVSIVAGNEVTLTSNLSDACDAGRAVVNRTQASKYGIEITTASWSGGEYPNYWTWKMSGVYISSSTGLSMSHAYAMTSGFISSLSKAKITPFLFDNIYTPGFYFGANSSDAILQYYKNSQISNIYSFRYSGDNVTISGGYNYHISNIFAGTYVSMFILSGVNHVVENYNGATSWGNSGVSTTYSWHRFSGSGILVRNSKMQGGSLLLSIINSSFSDCWIDTGTVHQVGSAVSTEFFNCEFGMHGSNSYAFNANANYTELKYYNCLFGGSIFNDSGVPDWLPGSSLKVDSVDENTNDHRSYYPLGKIISSGTGLTDTTAHTLGGFAIRLEPTSSTDRLEWDFNVPTGNIQNQTMMVAVWCKLNSAAYWAGTHQMPRLTVDYDNGTIAYAQAAQTTDWQLLSLPFTPLTTFGQIKVTLSGMTDATGSDAYIYFDDFSTLYPAGYKLDLGGFDLWADALPITPPIATVMSPMDVWVAQSSIAAQGEGSMGKLLADGVTAIGAVPTNPLLDNDARLDYLDARISSLQDAVANNVFNDLTYDGDGVAISQGSISSGTPANTTSIGTHLVLTSSGAGIDVDFEFELGTGRVSELVVTGYYTGSGGAASSKYASVYLYDYTASAWTIITDGSNRIPSGSANVSRQYAVAPQFQQPGTGTVKVRYVSSRVNSGDNLYIDMHYVQGVNSGPTLAEMANAIWQYAVTPEAAMDGTHSRAAWFLWVLRPIVGGLDAVNGNVVTCSGDRFSTSADYSGHTIQFHLSGTTDYRFAKIVSQDGADLTLDELPSGVDDTWHFYILPDRSNTPTDIAAAVLDEPLDSHVTAGSLGDFIKNKLLTVAKFLGLK